MPNLFVIAHESLERGPAARNLKAAAAAARESGLIVINIPFPFPDPARVLPSTFPGSICAYSGPIPQKPAHYQSLQTALAAAGVGLVNSAAASAQATYIERWWHLLGELTAKTVVIRNHLDLEDAAALTFPLFVKGGVKSAKEQGLAACLAADAFSLAARAEGAFARGQIVVARELLPLRQSGDVVMDFPQAREYRVMLFDQKVLAHRFYWSERDPLGALTACELEAVLDLAREAASRLQARALAVDIAELEDGSWRVIEVGDAQHTGLAHIQPHSYWQALQAATA